MFIYIAWTFNPEKIAETKIDEINLTLDDIDFDELIVELEKDNAVQTAVDQITENIGLFYLLSCHFKNIKIRSRLKHFELALLEF